MLLSISHPSADEQDLLPSRGEEHDEKDGEHEPKPAQQPAAVVVAAGTPALPLRLARDEWLGESRLRLKVAVPARADRPSLTPAAAGGGSYGSWRLAHAKDRRPQLR